MKKQLFTALIALLAVSAFAQPTLWGGAKIKFQQGDTVFTRTAGDFKTWLGLSGGGTVSTVSATDGNGFDFTITNGSTTPNIALATTVTGMVKGNGTGFSAASSGTDYVIPSGSVATLTTPRSIYGNNFDGSAALNQIIASTFGGTGNGFAKFSGPATSEKTFTLPNASATILTDNAPVTAPQGGTGQSSYTTGDIIYASGATALSKLSDIATGNVLITGGVGVAPSYGKVNLTTHVSSILPVLNGGTNLTSVGSDVTLLGSNGSANIYYTLARTNNSAAIGWSRSSTTLNFNLPPADASFEGLVSTGAQTMAGNKTWTGTQTVTGIITGNGGIRGVAVTGVPAVNVSGVADADFAVVTANTTLDETHNYVSIGTLTADITISLPACNSTRDGWEYRFIKLGSDSFAFIIDPNSTETFFDNATTKTIYSQGNGASCKCRSSNSTWFFQPR